ncbi:MAG: type II secretion system protein [Fimbriimonadaceae bacterium]
MQNSRTFSNSTFLKKQAFTMIEVLVVIAILGILMALVFPVYGHVVSTTRETRCVNNLHQIGKGLLLYGATHDDALPWAPNEAAVYYVRLSGQPDPFYTTPTVKQVLMPYLREPSVFRSPSDIAFTGMVDTEGTFVERQPPGFYERMGSSYRVEQSGPDRLRMLSQVQNPSRRLLASALFAFHGTSEDPKFSILYFDMSARIRPWAEYPSALDIP